MNYQGRFHRRIAALTAHTLFLGFAVSLAIVYVLKEIVFAKLQNSALDELTSLALLLLLPMSFLLLGRYGKEVFLEFILLTAKAASCSFAILSLRCFWLRQYGRINPFEVCLTILFSLAGPRLLESVIYIMRAWGASFLIAIKRKSQNLERKATANWEPEQ